MKMSLKKVTVALGILAFSTVSYGQKKNITNAAIEYGKLKPMLYSGSDIPGAKKSVIKAKGFIDLAAEHPDTKGNQKMFLFKGEIYTALSILLAMDETIADATPESAMAAAIDAYKMGMEAGKKYKLDIIDAAKEKSGYLLMMSDMAWQEEKYGDAAEGYEYAAQYTGSIGILDTNAIFNAGVGYENSDNLDKALDMYEKLADVKYRGAKGERLKASIYKKKGDPTKAIEILEAARKDYPNDQKLLLGLINANIDAGNSEGAEKSLADAIAADPKNELLHYNSGTIYINIGDKARTASEEAEDADNMELKYVKLVEAFEAYGKAEKALQEALNLKADYVDALYQQGAHLYNWGSLMKAEASFLDPGDAREAEWSASAQEKMNGSITTLEKYIEHEPNDKGILNILYKAYKKNENEEKAAEYKARMEAL